MEPTPRSPESSARLESADTNPLPNVSSAKAWTALSFPKASHVGPIIREKVAAPPRPQRRFRADGTEEICVEDIMVIVPRASAPPPRVIAVIARPQPSTPQSMELGDDDLIEEAEEEIVVEHAPVMVAARAVGPAHAGAPAPVLAPPPRTDGPFRPPAYSVHATQEILPDDVLDVQQAAQQIQTRDERPSTMPWTVDNPLDEFEFPQPPQMSGAYGAVRRITNYSATQVFRRRSMNVKVVAAFVGMALSLVVVAGIARFAPSSVASEGPVGIAMRSPKKLDKSVRSRVLSYGNAPHIDNGVTISIDSLPFQAARRRR